MGGGVTRGAGVPERARNVSYTYMYHDEALQLPLILHHPHWYLPNPDDPSDLLPHPLPDPLKRLFRASLPPPRDPDTRTINAQLVESREPPAQHASADDLAFLVDGRREAREEDVPRVEDVREEVSVEWGGRRGESDFETTEGGGEGVEEGEGG